MRANRIRAGVERGELQIGTWINLIRNPAILPLLKAAGLDFARVDMEHSSPSIETIADMAVLARALDFPIVVRPPRANREWITRLLDVGVWNLHCPQVDIGRACRRDRRGVALCARGPARHDRARAPATTSALPARRPSAKPLRHRLVLSEGARGGEHDGHDGTGRWPGGARPSRWRRRASA